MERSEFNRGAGNGVFACLAPDCQKCRNRSFLWLELEVHKIIGCPYFFPSEVDTPVRGKSKELGFI
jgi:hypothetical protein